MINENGKPVISSQQPSEQVRSLTRLIDDAVTAARENADGHEVRISFRDVTENDQPEISSEPMFAGIPMITTNMQEIPIQEKTMEEVQSTVVETIDSVIESTDETVVITPAQQMVAQMFTEENVKEHPIKEVQALQELVNKMKAYAAEAGRLVNQPSTGDLDLDSALQQELNYVLDRCEALTKDVNAAAEALVKNPPKEPEPKSELRITVENFFSRNATRVQDFTSTSYHRTREFIGMPIKPAVSPQQHLLNIQKAFATMNDELLMAGVAARKAFHKEAHAL